jgi:multiple sugar transport system substrate-binding protein
LHGAAGSVAASVFTPSILRAEEAALKVVWMGWPEEQVMPLMKEVEKRTTLKLGVERLPFNQIFQTLEVRLNARNGDPDVFIVDSPLTASYAARGHLMELDALIDKSRFVPSAIAAASYQGKIYSAPFGSSMQELYYNTAMFKAAGVEPPSTDPAKRWTWEQVVDAAKKLTKPSEGVWGFVFEQSERPYQLLPLGQSLGGKAISDDGLTASGYIDSQPFIDAYSFMQKLYTEWKVSPQGQFDTALTPELFGSQKTAMLLGNTFNLETFQKKYPGTEFGVAPHPYFAKGKPVTPTGAWHFGINARTKNKDAAAIFLKTMLSDDLQDMWFKLRPYLPVAKSIWEREAAEFAKHPLWKIVEYDLDNTAVARPATPGWREYEDILRVALRDIQTGANVKTSLQAAAQKIDRELAKYKG